MPTRTLRARIAALLHVARPPSARPRVRIDTAAVLTTAVLGTDPSAAALFRGGGGPGASASGGVLRQ
jgi:hypothetical protein